MVATGGYLNLKFSKISSSVVPVIFQVLSGRMWLAAAMLDSTDCSTFASLQKILVHATARYSSHDLTTTIEIVSRVLLNLTSKYLLNLPVYPSLLCTASALDQDFGTSFMALLSSLLNWPFQFHFHPLPGNSSLLLKRIFSKREPGRVAPN